MTPYNFEPRHGDMGHHIASGLVNSGIFNAVKLACQFASVIVLSRLLPPSDFGLVAMTGPVYGFIALFQDFGLSQATIQKPGLTHAEVNAFFWINIAVGAVLAAFVVAISPAVGWYYHEPRAVALTAAMGLLILFGAVGNQQNAILTRRMEFGLMTWNGTIGAAIGLIVSVAAALILKNYWALYYGMVAGTFCPVIGIWIVTRWRPSAPRRVRGLGPMLKFGAGVTTASLAGFFSGNTDNVLIGHRWGDHPLGLYDRAYKLLLFPLQKVVGPVTGTLVPVLSRLTTDPARYRAIFLKALAQTVLLAWPGIIWAILLADTLMPTLLGKQWMGSAPIFELLAIAGLLQTVNYFQNSLFISQGRTGEYARWSVIGAIANVAAFVIGLPYGPVGVAGAYAISETLRTPFGWWYVGRKGPVRPLNVIREILPQAAGALVAALALLGYRTWIAATPPLLFLGGGLIIAYAAAALVMSLSAPGRETLKQSLIAGRKILGHLKGGAPA